MSRTYDNWERLTAATLKREQFRQLALSFSRETSFSSTQSDSTFDSHRYSDPEASIIPGNTADSVARYPFYNGGIIGSHLSEAVGSLPRDIKHIALKELKKATRNFRVDLLLGSCNGNIYKGWVDEHTLAAAKPGNGIPVTVKKFKPISKQNRFGLMLRLQKEIQYMSQFDHPNLVKLIGYCFEDDCLLLVHELMQKGSLCNHLFREHNQTLSWASRINIALGVARGLCFLHDREIQVLHQNFTSANILLDGDFNSKLSNFGIGRDGPIGVTTEVYTEVSDTYVYCAPEYVVTGLLSTKNDVYSFGVVLLELLSGRRSIDTTKSGAKQDLVNWVNHYLSDETKFLQIMDRKLNGQYPLRGSYTAAKVALRCVSYQARHEGNCSCT